MVIVNNNIAYFLGALHSDGCIYQFYDKKEKRIRYRLLFCVSKKSLLMLKRCQFILEKELNRKLNIRQNKNGYFRMETCVNKTPWLIMNNYEIPSEIKKSSSLFGAYLAGVIDGDGHIHIKNNKDRKIPQCAVKIASAEPLREIKRLTEKHMGCSVNFEFTKNERGQGYKTYFYVSYKNFDFIEKYLLPYIQLEHKKERLIQFRSIYGL
jgi:hypothetical protein